MQLKEFIRVYVRWEFDRFVGNDGSKGLFRFAYGASIFGYVSNMKIESKHAKYGLTIALSTIRPGGVHIPFC
jgi:hypothetical protein